MKAIRTILPLLLFVSTAFADTIYLKNGQSFRGDLVRVTAETIVIEYGHGHGARIDFPASQIDRVEAESGALLYRDGAAVSPDPSRAGDDGVYFVGDDGRRPRVMASEALSRGSYAVGGLVSFSSSGGDIYRGAFGMEGGGRQNLFAVAPAITFFLTDGLGLGLDLLYRRQWLSGQSQDQLALGPRVIYALPVEGVARPYLGAGVGLLRWRFAEDGQYSEIGMTARAGGGIYYFLNGRYAATVDVSYQWDRFDPDAALYPVTGNSILLSVGLTGFLY